MPLADLDNQSATTTGTDLSLALLIQWQKLKIELTLKASIGGLHFVSYHPLSLMLSKEHSFSEKACSNVKWILKTTAYQYELSFAWWYDSKISKQINLTLKASIAYNLNVASFHLLLLQQTICEFLADEGFVNGEALKS